MLDAVNTHAYTAVQLPQQTRAAAPNPPTVAIPAVNGANEQSQAGMAQHDAQHDPTLAAFAHQHHQALQGYLNLNRAERAEHSVGTSSSITDNEDTVATSTTDKRDDALNPQARVDKTASETKDSDEDTEDNDTGSDGQPLSDEEQQKLDAMQERHDEVKVHEQAHKSAGGSLAAAPSYSYETGPDGKRYITDGEVQIDTSKEKDPTGAPCRSCSCRTFIAG